MSDSSHEQLLLNEVQLLLSEKRTYYSIFRSGGAILGLSVSALGTIIATDQYTELFTRPSAGSIIAAIFGAMLIIGVWLTSRSYTKIKRLDRMIKKIESENKRIAELVV